MATAYDPRTQPPPRESPPGAPAPSRRRAGAAPADPKFTARQPSAFLLALLRALAAWPA